MHASQLAEMSLWRISVNPVPHPTRYINALRIATRYINALLRVIFHVVTTDGCRHLGSALGSQQFVREFVSSKVATWSQELSNLSEIARSQPQAVYSALIHDLQHKWSFLCRVLQVTSDHLAPLEDLILHRVIPAITGRVAPSEVERLLLPFLCRHGGLGISDPTSLGAQYASSGA